MVRGRRCDKACGKGSIRSIAANDYYTVASRV